ncbi:MAG: gliding motility-associated C-terminal domain-containing protein [Saprospiraceae bacterium]|nr:gliding motility-associated C-terminal domain-containing protein [Saprospiraceae bacterium]
MLEKKIESEVSISPYYIPFVVDLDNDCIPEIVTKSYLADSLLIFDSKTVKIKWSFPKYVSYSGISNLVFVDIDNDSIPEIISHHGPSGGMFPTPIEDRLICYKTDGTVVWISDQTLNFNSISSASIGVADFNQDGIPEVYLSNKIFNATTGVQICEGGNFGNGRDYQNRFHFPISIAANLDNDSLNLELAAGYTIYKVLISNVNGLIGNQMIPINFSLNGQYLDGPTSIADINSDGILDVIVTVPGDANNAILYVYYLDTGIPRLLARATPPTSIIGSSGNYISHATIGKLRKNNLPSILLSRPNLLISYSYTGSSQLRQDWNFVTTDTSGSTGISLFDFHGDGIQEIIYRDMTKLKIINGSGNLPIVLSQADCLSPTYNEFPIVANIDNTGEAKICVMCSNSTNYSDSKLTVFGPPDGQHWAPARSVWNQYAYNPLQINDDLTVPRVQKNQATYMGGKYNNFMQQESLLDSNGYYKVPAASLTGLIHCVDYDPLTNRFTVSFDLHNRRDASRLADSGLPVSFYASNPENVGDTLGVYYTGQAIFPGDTLRDLSFSFVADSSIRSIYLVVNTRRNGAGVFDSTHFDQPECDYTDNFYYTIELPQIRRDTQNVCEGSGYVFYDTTIYDAGRYHHVQENQSGCDSLIVLLDLSLSQTIHRQSSIEVCDQYNWNGKTLSQSGIYSDTSLTQFGCDSIHSLNLTINLSTNETQNISACDQYDWNGQTYTASGTYSHIGQTVHGCDSMVRLNLTIHPSENIEISQQACHEYFWNGNHYTTSGKYTFQTQSQYSCDSTVILNLTIDTVIRQQISHQACDRYQWNGNTYTQSGIYAFTASTQNGCDSIVSLNLEILQSSNSTENVNSCDAYTWNGNTYTQSGNYEFKTQNRNGCDSIATLQLTILQSTQSLSQVSTCDLYSWNGNTYTQSGNYEFKSQNSEGCDSTAVLELVILPSHQLSITHSACDRYVWNGMTYDQSGNYSFSTKNQFGCDSSISLDLEILKSSSANISLSTCDSLVFDGQVLKESGIYPFKISNQAGCDSTIHLNLSILSSRQIDSVSSCDPFLWNQDGQNYTQSGHYQKNFINSAGCDSLFILNFVRLPEYSSQEKIELCDPYFWPVANKLLDQSGIYTELLKTHRGCDSSITLDLLIHSKFIHTDSVISPSDYLWPVNNHTYSSSGIYEEKYSSGFGCDSIHRLVLLIQNETGIYYPNVLIPGGISGGFTIYDNLHSIASIATLSIYDRWGSLVWQKHNLSPNDPTQGWDGRFKNQPVLPGVYTWHAQLALKDGGYLTVKGDLTVLR